MPPKQTTPNQNNQIPPSITKNKVQPQSNTMDYEYTQRLLYLFTSFYDEPSIDEITSLKDIKLEPSIDEVQQPKQIPFYSGVWDLKLRKAVDQRIINDQIASDALSDQVLQLRESLSNETPDLNDVFVPRNTERPQIPTYLKYIEEDEKKLNDFSHQRAKPSNLNFQQNSRIFSEKLRRQKETSKVRARNRFIKAKQVEKDHRDFVNSLHKSQFCAEADKRLSDAKKYKYLQEQKERQSSQCLHKIKEIQSKSPRRPTQ